MSDGLTGHRPLNEVGEGFHDERWKLFFLRTLALYAARIAAVASFVMLNTLPAVDGTVEATLGARECGCVSAAKVDNSRRGGSVAVVGEMGTGMGSRRGEKTGDGSDDSQLSYWLGVEDDDEVLGSTLEKRWWCGW